MNENFKPQAMTEWERLALQRKVEHQHKHRNFKTTLSPLCKSYCVNSIYVDFNGSGDSGQIDDVVIQFSSHIEPMVKLEKPTLIKQALERLGKREHRPLKLPPTADFDVSHLHSKTAVPSDSWYSHHIKSKYNITEDQAELTAEVHRILTERFNQQVFRVDKVEGVTKQVTVETALDDWCYDQLEQTGHDWYNNDGGSGNFTFEHPDDDADFNITLEMNIYRQEADEYSFNY